MVLTLGCGGDNYATVGFAATNFLRGRTSLPRGGGQKKLAREKTYYFINVKVL